MTQSAYLSAYQSPDAGTTRQFSVAPGIPWQRWYNHAAASGVLDALTGSKGAPVSPSDLANGVVPPSSQVIKVIELKLSRNRVYVVAAREPALNNGPMSSMPSDLVFFISLRVGDGVNEDPAAGSLVMGELRFVANGTESGCGVWERCDVTLKSKMNARMWVGLERAISAVLRS